MSTRELERRKYFKDSTEEEIEALRARVTILEDKIVLLKEIPVVTPFSIDTLFAKMKEISSSFDACGFLIDLTDTGMPDAISRRQLNSQFKLALSNVKHVSFVTGKNFIINTAARFVMHQTNLKSYSVNKTLEEGVLEIKKVLNEL